MNIISRLWQTPPARDNAEELYSAIVAQARLPYFYAKAGVPDTLEGRFVMLSMHYFALLHRLKQEGPAAQELAQELVDRFSADMETVLRELGISDLRIPKRVRGVSATNHGLALAFEKALAEGNAALEETIAEVLPLPQTEAMRSARLLSPYLQQTVAHLRSQPLETLETGNVQFPEMA
ncbi:ubiquinol-cytochrome C chaperone family protein [Methyloligella sp. 2.7D]|uniref:ubiquinol-cytochrome C chaperone family protein n=1 Tax=unclassified Methyloligella TaxID=2625955 RepID=UPI00157CCDE0|nr:ubiquinol-cytochrome C chaperone family protein [Methyloligella sp. GL2]QKP77591.1 ubiquinol-cytochrome C chaperone [Methyloligella sp. GL2]